MKKLILSNLLMLSLITGYSQYDFKIEWLGYDEGDEVTNTTESNPFIGDFKITNVGTEEVPIGDTIFVGYLIDGVRYDIGLSGAFDITGLFVTDFPLSTDTYVTVTLGEDIILDSEMGGGEAEICVVFYGVGLAATDLTFATDINPEDNIFCVTGIKGDLAGVDEIEPINFDLTYQNGLLLVNQTGGPTDGNSNINVYSISGQVMHNETLNNVNSVDLAHLTSGIYIVQIQTENESYSQKIVIP